MAKKHIYITPTPRWPSSMKMPEGQAERIPGTPRDILAWGAKKSTGHILLSLILGTVYAISLTLLPWALGRMIDSGIHYGFTSDFFFNTAIFMSLILMLVITGINETVGVSIWLRGAWMPARRLISVLFGHRTDATRDIPSGDIVTAITQDTQRIGGFYAFFPDFIGSLLSAAVAIVLMLRISIPLGLIVTVGLPLVMFLSTRIVVPLQKKMTKQREESGILTSIATDGVSGLRVLRGIGGEDAYNLRYSQQSAKVRQAGIEVAPYRALLTVIQSAGPTLFIAIVISGGLYLSYTGRMTPGQLVTFYGFASYLGLPLTSLGNIVAMASRARVGAEKIARILDSNYLVSNARVEPNITDIDWSTASLQDMKSGVAIEAGKITALVSPSPDESAQIAARLGRTNDAEHVTVNNIDIRSFPVDTVRSHVAYSGPIAEIYSGTLRSNLLGADAVELTDRTIAEQVVDILEPGGEIRPILSEPPGDHPRDPYILANMKVADGHDVVTSVRGGLNGHVAERGRSLSGGQRQRLALARVLSTEAPVMILVEPTSALDSHTELRAAHNVALSRKGRTTVVVTTSPLVLGQCDEVVLVVDGHEIARGTHHQLSDHPIYQAVVHRGETDIHFGISQDKDTHVGQASREREGVKAPADEDKQAQCGEERKEKGEKK